MKTSNYSIDTVLELVEDAPELVRVFFTVATEEMEGRTFRNFEITCVWDTCLASIEFKPHEDDIMAAIKENEGNWVREYD